MKQSQWCVKFEAELWDEVYVQSAMNVVDAISFASNNVFNSDRKPMRGMNEVTRIIAYRLGK